MREDDFLTDEGRALWQHMVSFLKDPRSKGAQLGPNVMKELYKTFDLCDDPSMTLEAYCILVRKNRLAIEIQGYAQELAGSGEDPLTAAERCVEKLQRNIISLGYGIRNDVEFDHSIGRMIEEHDLRAKGVDLSVAKWPWAPFNQMGGGVEKDDYIVFYGRPKSKKSWVLAEFAASLYDQGKVPLIYTKEMTADNIFKRLAACLARLPYQELRMGRLNDAERKRLIAINELAKELKHQQNMICLDGKDANGGDTIEWLESKVNKYRPDVVIIDGLYLMNDRRGPRGQKDNFRVQNISRAARQMVLDTGVPVIATMQATRGAAAHKSANLDEIAYSDAIAQDVTAAIRVINEDQTDTITLVVGGSREYRFSGCRIWGIPGTDFSWIENLNQREIDKVKQRDEHIDEKETGNTANGASKPAGPSKAKLRKMEDNTIARQFARLSR